MKDSYDEFLQFSRITHENWLEPDCKHYVSRQLTQQQWISMFLEPRLLTPVPKDVIQVFETARGCMIYSWFFYPLATLGAEQCTRVAEFAVKEGCRFHKLKVERNFAENLKTLVFSRVISAEEECRWQAFRRLRNDRSHIDSFMLIDPGMAMGSLQSLAELTNQLFQKPNP